MWKLEFYDLNGMFHTVLSKSKVSIDTYIKSNKVHEYNLVHI